MLKLFLMLILVAGALEFCVSEDYEEDELDLDFESGEGREETAQSGPKGIPASNTCVTPPECKFDFMPPETPQFPESNEELQELCERMIKDTECGIHFEETCLNRGPEDLQKAYKYLAAIREICSEDTLLHAAVVDNLKCFSKLVEEGDFLVCRVGKPEPENSTLALIEEGIISLIDNEIISASYKYKLNDCINTLKDFACVSLYIERECGNVAMKAYVEIMQKVAPTMVQGCEASYGFLPAVISLLKVEEERERCIDESSQQTEFHIF